MFAIIVLNEGLPGGDHLAVAVMCTVGLSLVTHGVSANPLANWNAGEEAPCDRGHYNLSTTFLRLFGP